MNNTIEFDLNVNKVRLALSYFEYEDLNKNRDYYTRMMKQYGSDVFSFWYKVSSRINLLKGFPSDREFFFSENNLISAKELEYGKSVGIFKHYSNLNKIYIEERLNSMVSSSLPVRNDFSLNLYVCNDDNFLVYINEFPLTDKLKTRKSILFADIQVSKSDLLKITESDNELFRFVIRL